MTARRRIIPEVVQTSAMDCGPASLKCLLEGFGVPASYGRLREACQTDVDGTSIDTIEEIARLLGLDAEQIMVPTDHVLVPEAHALPAIAVVRLPNGSTHFVVIWNRFGPFVQIMDPAGGRRWKTSRQIERELYVHSMNVPADGWREYAGSSDFTDPLRSRLVRIGFSPADAPAIILAALEDPGWRTIAALDAACRCVAAIVAANGLKKGLPATELCRRLARTACEDVNVIPANFWNVRPAGESNDELTLRGAVLVRARGMQAGFDSVKQAEKLTPELAEAIRAPEAAPAAHILELLRKDGFLNVWLMLSLLGMTSVVLLIQALLFRGLIGVVSRLGTGPQLVGASVVLLLLVSWLVLQRTIAATAVFRYGRLIETRLRLALLEKIPRLGDRYFQSRLTGDMAERGHSLHNVRMLPLLASRILSSFIELVLVVAGIIWLDPQSAPFALAAGVASLAIPLALQGPLAERDLRVRAHNGALARLYLDAMIGLTAIRAHTGEQAVRREQEDLLSHWISASVGLLRTTLLTDGLQTVIAIGLTATMLLRHLAARGDAGTSLLLVYWGLTLPYLGTFFATALRQYPSTRNVYLRVIEPLGAPDEEAAGASSSADLLSTASRQPPTANPVAIQLRDVSVRVAGHTILSGVNLDIAPGEHLAIVGRSGAGKSTLVGLFLGWHRPSAGTLAVDGKTLSGEELERLRRSTAWVDPAIQLWNRTLLDNLLFGSEGQTAAHVPVVLEQADIVDMLERMPEGLSRRLGEGGGLVSGGEGQRVRLGRAMMRHDARLVILDEPFRGLDRARRQRLLARARMHWSQATLLCITHDITETAFFPRALVLDSGAIVEDVNPAEALRDPHSRYAALFAQDERVHRERWGSSDWKRMRVEGGQLVES